MAGIFGARRDRYNAAPSPSASPDQQSTPSLKADVMNNFQARNTSYDAPLKASGDMDVKLTISPGVTSQTPTTRGNRVSTRLASDLQKPEFLTGVISTVNELQVSAPLLWQHLLPRPGLLNPFLYFFPFFHSV